LELVVNPDSFEHMMQLILVITLVTASFAYLGYKFYESFFTDSGCASSCGCVTKSELKKLQKNSR